MRRSFLYSPVKYIRLNAFPHSPVRLPNDCNVHVYTEDGTLGLPQAAPFDAIIVTASSEELPEPYQVQLSEGGRIIIPLGSESTGQRMYRFTLNNEKLSEEVLGAFVFVPLIGKYGHRSDHPE